MITLYTPGHNLITDALIMHGVVRILAHAGVYEGKVERVGERFVITADRAPKSADLLMQLLEAAELYLTTTESKGPLRKLDVTNVNPGVFKNWVSSISRALGEFDIAVYTDAGHKEKWREGRSRSMKLNTLYLSLSFIYGKYYVENYKVRETPYSLCDTCFVAANLGLVYGAAALVMRSRDKTDVVFMSPVPAESLSFYDLLLLQRLTERYEEVRKDIPTLAAPLYWLSSGETLYAVDAPLDLIVWRTSRSGNFQRSLESPALNLTALAECVAEIKYRVVHWPRVARQMIEEAPEVMAEIAEYILFGGDIYALARELAALSSRSGILGRHAKQLVEALLECFKK